MGNSVTTPPGVIRPACLRLLSMNHTLPSGPAAMPHTSLPRWMPAENDVTTPAGVIRPTPSRALNHMLPSGPAAIRTGELPAPARNSVTVAALAALAHALSAPASAAARVARRPLHDPNAKPIAPPASCQKRSTARTRVYVRNVSFRALESMRTRVRRR